LQVLESWVAEYYWSEHHPATDCGTGLNGSTGVLIRGEDNYVNNVIVFDFTCVGVLVDGAANILQGVRHQFHLPATVPGSTHLNVPQLYSGLVLAGDGSAILYLCLWLILWGAVRVWQSVLWLWLWL